MAEQKEVRAQRLYAGPPRKKENAADQEAAAKAAGGSPVSMEALLQLQADLAKKQAELDTMLKIMQQTMPATSGAVTEALHNTPDAVNLETAAGIDAAQKEVAADIALVNDSLTKKQKKAMRDYLDSDKQEKRHKALASKVHGAKKEKTEEQKTAAQEKRDVKYEDKKRTQLEAAAASKNIRTRYGIPAVPAFGQGDTLAVQWEPTTKDMEQGDMLVRVIRRGLGEDIVTGPDGKEHSVMRVKDLSTSPMKLKYYDLDSFLYNINRLAGKTGNAPVYETVYSDNSISPEDYATLSDAFEKGAPLTDTAIDKAWRKTQQDYREAQEAHIQDLLNKGVDIIDLGNGNYIMPMTKPEPEPDDFDDMSYNRYVPNALSEEISKRREKYNEVVASLESERNASRDAAVKAYLNSMNDYARDEVAGAIDQVKSYFPSTIADAFGEAGSPEHFLFKALQGKEHYNKLMNAANVANEQDSYDSVQFLPEPARTEALNYIESLNDMRNAFTAGELSDMDTPIGRQYSKEVAALNKLYGRGVELLPSERKDIRAKRNADMQRWQKSLDAINRVINLEPGYVKSRRDAARKIIEDAQEKGIDVDPRIAKQFMSLDDEKSRTAFIASLSQLAEGKPKEERDAMQQWAKILNAMKFLNREGKSDKVAYTNKDGNVESATYNNYYKKYAGMSTNDLLAKAAYLKNYIDSNDPSLTRNAQVELDKLNDILLVNRLNPASQIAGVSEVVYDDPKHPGKLLIRLNYGDELKKRIKAAGLDALDKQNKKYSDQWFISRGINPSYESRMKYLQDVADTKLAKSEDAYAKSVEKYAADINDEQREALQKRNDAVMEQNKLERTADNMRKQGVSEERVDAYVKSKGDKNAKREATYNDEAHKVIANASYRGNKHFRDIYNAAVHKAVMEAQKEYSKEDITSAYPISSFAKSYLAGRQDTAWEDAVAAAAKQRQQTQQSVITGAVAKPFEFNNLDSTTMYSEENTDALDDNEGEE